MPKNLLRRWVLSHAAALGDAQREWVEQSLSGLEAGGSERDLHIFMGFAPRRLGKGDLALCEADLIAADAAHPGWRPEGWTVDGAARVLGLLAHQSQRPFDERFKDLRRTADAAELIALYRGLPLYPEPEALFFEAGEGLRSNLLPVFEAIAHDNPFARDHFDDHRWNHMVLKALFVGSRLHPILGLDARANPELALILREYAHERWAAGRPVTPELWRCVGPFAGEDGAMADLERAFKGDDPLTRKAVALSLRAGRGAPHASGDALTAGSPEADAAASGALSWDSLNQEIAAARANADRGPVLPNAEAAR